MQIENHSGRLRLRWMYRGKKYRLTVGVNADDLGYSVAKQKASEIERDMVAGYFDESLLKYKPRYLGRCATDLHIPALFEKYSKVHAKEANLSEPSRQRYQACLNHLRSHLNIPAEQLSKRDVKRFVERLLDSVAEGTVKTYLWLLSSCWGWSQGQYHISENHWLEECHRIKPAPKQRVQPFTTAEVKAILEGFRLHPHYHHYYPFVLFLMNTGCRIGEAIGLQWQNLNPDLTVAWIGQSLTRGVRKTTKTGKAREVMLTPSVTAMLKELQAQRQAKPTDTVFLSPTGKPIDDHLFSQRIWRSLLESIGIEHRKPYTMRHTAISHALMNGAHYLDVASQTGHDAQTMYEHYASTIRKISVFREF